MMKWWSSLVLFALANFGFGQSPCTGQRYSQAAYFDSNQIDTLMNLTYGEAVQHFTGQNVELKMDVFMPSMSADPVATRPFVLLVHGGGFIAGDKSEMHYECAELARRGFVAATISYRLGWNCDNILCINCFGSNLQKAIYHAAQDVLAGLRFIQDQSVAWHVDPAQGFLGGESAGSIAALAAQHWNQTEADAWLPAGYASIAGGLNESGNSLTTLPTIRGMINHCGAVLNTSIIGSDSAVPMISFHDSNDCVVPFGNGPLIACICPGFLSFSGSNVLHSYYTNNSWCSELHIVPQVLPNHCQFPAYNFVELSACFMKRNLCGFCMSSQNSDIYVQAQCTGFASAPEPIGGCTYSEADNYSSTATFDDGSCVFTNCAADLNNDGIVSVMDLLLFIEAYGGICGE